MLAITIASSKSILIDANRSYNNLTRILRQGYIQHLSNRLQSLYKYCVALPIENFPRNFTYILSCPPPP